MSQPGKQTAKAHVPVTVSFGAKPVGEPVRVERWAHSTVWTERMLTALRTGVRGGKWHALFDKVMNLDNLRDAANKVLDKRGAPGVDRQTVHDFETNWDQELARLQSQLRQGTHSPAAVRRTWIPKPGSSEQRPLGIPTVRDRVVQTALVHAGTRLRVRTHSGQHLP